MDVVLYMRYSSDRQTEQSIEGQDRVCMEFCKAQGYNVIEKYIDRSTSAYHDSGKRHEFQRMIADSERHQWQGIVVYKLDRFARNRYDSAIYKAKLKKNGVRVISATENISDNPEGVLLESVLEGMAEFYSKELAQKISRGMNESALKCNSCGGSTPLGFKIVDKKYQIEPITAEYVRTAFQMYADGSTIADIYNLFNNRGWRTSTGGKFNKSSFKKMFANEKYIGVYKYKDIRIEGGIPAIIDKNVWDIVQARLGEKEKAPTSSRTVTDYLLSQKLFCGHCGGHMDGVSGTSRTGVKHYYYACYNKINHKGCDKKNIRKDVIERAVVQAAMGLLNPETIEYLAELAVKAADAEIKNNTMIPPLKNRLREIDRSINRLFKLVEDGAESPTLADRLNTLEKEKRTVEKQLLKEQQSITPLDKEQVIYFLEKFTDGDIEDFDFRRRITDMLVNRVWVFDKPDGDTELEIAFNITNEPKRKVSLKDIKSVKSSYVEDCVPPQSSYTNQFYILVRQKAVVVSIKIPSRV